jgi:hypothetical protein
MERRKARLAKFLSDHPDLAMRGSFLDIKLVKSAGIARGSYLLVNSLASITLDEANSSLELLGSGIIVASLADGEIYSCTDAEAKTSADILAQFVTRVHVAKKSAREGKLVRGTRKERRHPTVRGAAGQSVRDV